MLYILCIVVFTVYHSKNLDFYADSYMIFDRIMQIELVNYFQTDPTYLNKKCEKIVEKYLKYVDVEFYIFICKNQIDVKILLM